MHLSQTRTRATGSVLAAALWTLTLVALLAFAGANVPPGTLPMVGAPRGPAISVPANVPHAGERQPAPKVQPPTQAMR